MRPEFEISLVGKLIFSSGFRSNKCLIVALSINHPNIYYSVGVYIRYHNSPKESHLLAVKKIIEYISGTIKFRI